MNNRTFYNEVLTDHNRYPGHKEKLADANLVLEGVNPSCGDDIVLQLRVEDGRIAEGTFTGDGCAISQASVDIMLDLVIGKTKEEAMHLTDLFFRMIKGTVSDEELEELEEASALVDNFTHAGACQMCGTRLAHAYGAAWGRTGREIEKYRNKRSGRDRVNLCCFTGF